MNLRISGVFAVAAFVVTCLLGSPQSLAQNAYITNGNSSTVSVIDTATNTVTATIRSSRAGPPPAWRSARTAAKSTSRTSAANGVSVIDTATNTVTATISVGRLSLGVAVTPDGSKVYVANASSNNVSVIATATNTVTATIPVGALHSAWR